VLLLAGAAAAAEQGRDYEEEYERGFEEDAEDPDSPQARGRRKMENMMRLVRSLEALTAAEVYDWAYGWAAAHSTMLVVMAVVVRGPRRRRRMLTPRVIQRRQLISRPCADLRAALRGGAHLRQRCAPALLPTPSSASPATHCLRLTVRAVRGCPQWIPRVTEKSVAKSASGCSVAPALPSSQAAYFICRRRAGKSRTGSTRDLHGLGNAAQQRCRPRQKGSSAGDARSGLCASKSRFTTLDCGRKGD